VSWFAWRLKFKGSKRFSAEWKSAMPFLDEK